MKTYKWSHKNKKMSLNNTFYYGNDPCGNAIEGRPLEWFADDLAALAALIDDALVVEWDRTAACLISCATRLHLSTGAGDWRGTWTRCRVHAIGEHGFQYLSLCFSSEPEARWFIGGARHISPGYDWTGTVLREIDDRYAVDAFCGM